ncbi:hypothetical protein ACJX0J_008909, partial [Zea mays]
MYPQSIFIIVHHYMRKIIARFHSIDNESIFSSMYLHDLLEMLSYIYSMLIGLWLFGFISNQIIQDSFYMLWYIGGTRSDIHVQQGFGQIKRSLVIPNVSLGSGNWSLLHSRVLMSYILGEEFGTYRGTRVLRVYERNTGKKEKGGGGGGG